MYISELMYGKQLECHSRSGSVDPQLHMLVITAASWIHSQARNKQPAASSPYALSNLLFHWALVCRTNMKVSLSSRMHRGTLTRMGAACTLKPQTLNLGFTLEYDSLIVLRVWCRSSQKDLKELGDLCDLLSGVIFKTTFIMLPNQLLNQLMISL